MRTVCTNPGRNKREAEDSWGCQRKPLHKITSYLRMKHRLTNQFRAYLHGGGGPQVGEVTRLGGVTRLSI